MYFLAIDLALLKNLEVTIVEKLWVFVKLLSTMNELPQVRASICDYFRKIFKALGAKIGRNRSEVRIGIDFFSSYFSRGNLLELLSQTYYLELIPMKLWVLLPVTVLTFQFRLINFFSP